MSSHRFRGRLNKKSKEPQSSKGHEKEFHGPQLGYQMLLAREAAGMTQMQLAAEIGTRQANISRMEMGGYNFTIEMLQRIARALSIELKIKFSTNHKSAQNSR